MLSEKIKKKQKVYSVCGRNNAVKTGDVFDGGVFAEDPVLPSAVFDSRIYIHGRIAQDELLASAGNQRYFFSLKDGWGAEGSCLFAIKLGFLTDFGHPMTREDMQALANKPLNRKGVYASLAERGKREQIRMILSKMQERGCGDV